VPQTGIEEIFVIPHEKIGAQCMHCAPIIHKLVAVIAAHHWQQLHVRVIAQPYLHGVVRE